MILVKKYDVSIFLVKISIFLVEVSVGISIAEIVSLKGKEKMLEQSIWSS